MPKGAINGLKVYSVNILINFHINIKGSGKIIKLPLMMVLIRSSHTIVANGNKTHAIKTYVIARNDVAVVLDSVSLLSSIDFM